MTLQIQTLEVHQNPHFPQESPRQQLKRARQDWSLRQDQTHQQTQLTATHYLPHHQDSQPQQQPDPRAPRHHQSQELHRHHYQQRLHPLRQSRQKSHTHKEQDNSSHQKDGDQHRHHRNQPLRCLQRTLQLRQFLSPIMLLQIHLPPPRQ